MRASTRRAALGAILTAPLASVPAVALTANVRSDVPDHEARFLALVPWLKVVVPPAEEAKARAKAVAAKAEAEAGEHPGWDRPYAVSEWVRRDQANRMTMGYTALWSAWNDATDPIDEAVTDLMDQRMTTLFALAWKARVADLLDCWEEQVGYDLAAMAREGTICA